MDCMCLGVVKEEKLHRAGAENEVIIVVERPSCHDELVGCRDSQCLPVAARLFAQLPPPSRIVYVTSRGLPRDDFIVPSVPR